MIRLPVYLISFCGILHVLVSCGLEQKAVVSNRSADEPKAGSMGHPASDVNAPESGSMIQTSSDVNKHEASETNKDDSSRPSEEESLNSGLESNKNETEGNNLEQKNFLQFSPIECCTFVGYSMPIDYCKDYDAQMCLVEEVVESN